MTTLATVALLGQSAELQLQLHAAQLEEIRLLRQLITVHRDQQTLKAKSKNLNDKLRTVQERNSELTTQLSRVAREITQSSQCSMCHNTAQHNLHALYLCDSCFKKKSFELKEF